MTDKYAKLRKDVPQAIEEAKAEGGINHRAQMIADLLADYDRMREALSGVLADLEMRAEDGVMDISQGVLDKARAALAQEGS